MSGPPTASRVEEDGAALFDLAPLCHSFKVTSKLNVCSFPASCLHLHVVFCEGLWEASAFSRRGSFKCQMKADPQRESGVEEKLQISNINSQFGATQTALPAIPAQSESSSVCRHSCIHGDPALLFILFVLQMGYDCHQPTFSDARLKMALSSQTVHTSFFPASKLNWVLSQPYLVGPVPLPSTSSPAGLA